MALLTLLFMDTINHGVTYDFLKTVNSNAQHS